MRSEGNTFFLYWKTWIFSWIIPFFLVLPLFLFPFSFLFLFSPSFFFWDLLSDAIYCPPFSYASASDASLFERTCSVLASTSLFDFPIIHPPPSPPSYPPPRPHFPTLTKGTLGCSFLFNSSHSRSWVKNCQYKFYQRGSVDNLEILPDLRKKRPN